MKCIYQIINLKDGKRYIGSTTDFNRRMSQHLGRLRLGKHHSKHLQNAWERDGEESFRFEVLEEAERSELTTIEQKWLIETNVCDPAVGYNKAPLVGSYPGFGHTVESRLAMSNARSGHRGALHRLKPWVKVVEERRDLQRSSRRFDAQTRERNEPRKQNSF